MARATPSLSSHESFEVGDAVVPRDGIARCGPTRTISTNAPSFASPSTVADIVTFHDAVGVAPRRTV